MSDNYSPHHHFGHHIPMGLAFDDVLIVPQYSEITSRSQVTTRSRLIRDIEIQVPIISSNMDTVTMAEMAIAMARVGGIGLIHRFLSIEKEVRQVEKVKRYRSHVIDDPYTIRGEQTVAEANEIMAEHQIGGLMVVNERQQLVGIITVRDLFNEDNNGRVVDLMTPRERMIVGDPNTSPERAAELMHGARIEKLPLVDNDEKIVGLIVMKDIRKLEDYPHSTMDSAGRLMVGASVGVVNEYLDRTEALLNVGADIIAVDVAHGHALHVGRAVKELRKRYPDVPLMVGDVATAEGVEYLVECGADAVRCGIGPGSACTTRLVAGAGVPQFSALMECAQKGRELGIPIIADGGIRPGEGSRPGGADLSKAIGAGANAAILGSALAGVVESPGRIEERGGQRVKTYRGMASMDAFLSKQMEEGKADESGVDYVPEGVTGVVPFKDETAAQVVHKLAGGLRSGMAYSNARTVEEFQERVKFVQQTSAGLGESRPHVLERNG